MKPDAVLVESAVRNAGRSGQRRERWAAVMDALAVGSTMAWDLCRRFNLDPEERVGLIYDEDEPGCIECGGPLPGPSYAVCDTCLRSHAQAF